MDIECESFLNVIHQVSCAGRAPHLKRNLARNGRGPWCEKEIGNIDYMIGMKMCKEQLVDLGERDSELREMEHNTASAVKEESLTPGFYQSTRSEPLQANQWPAASSKEDDLKVLRPCA